MRVVDAECVDLISFEIMQGLTNFGCIKTLIKYDYKTEITGTVMRVDFQV